MTADIREVVRLLEEARASGADERQLALSDGRQVRFRRAPTPGLVYSLTVQEAGGREDLLFAQFDAAESRPTDYPPEAPFLPGQPVGVFSPGAGSWVLTWEAVADPAHLVTAVLADNERDGWELQTTPATGGLLPVTRTAFTAVSDDEFSRSCPPGRGVYSRCWRRHALASGIRSPLRRAAVRSGPRRRAPNVGLHRSAALVAAAHAAPVR